MQQDGVRREMTRRDLLRRGLALGVGASAVALVAAACSTTREDVPSTLPPRLTPITSQPGLIVKSGTPSAGTPVASPAP